MKYSYRTMKNLFLRQSYIDSWEDYRRSLRKSSFITWDYVVLTASNEEQAESYRQQIDYRLRRKLLPDRTKYVVLPDPDGKRVGSGGATFYVMSYIAQMELQQYKEEEPGKQDQTGTRHSEKYCPENPFRGKRILVIHSGGDSKRVPQYSACGKLFAPVMRELPNGQSSSLFDEFIIGMSGVPARMQEGMLVLSGDVLLLFNPLQIDLQVNSAAAISMKEAVETGKDHGVFFSDEKGNVNLFLHKQPEERLRQLGAVDERGNVDLDTGAILMDGQMLRTLYALISTDGVPDQKKVRRFVNEKARVSFYGDFLYPLAKNATLENYCMEAAEGTICEELLWCRKQLWKALRGFTLKLIRVSPAEFIHFGTTKELAVLVTEGIDNYVFLDWKRQVMTNQESGDGYAVHTSYVEPGTELGRGSYIENSIIEKKVRIGKRSIVSGVDLEDVFVPEDVVLHGLQLQDGRYVVRIYGVEDNPKKQKDEGISLLGTKLEKFLDAYRLETESLWPEKAAVEDKSLWTANLYPICAEMREAIQSALELYKLISQVEKEDRGGVAAEECYSSAADRNDSDALLSKWLSSERISLCESFNHANIHAAVGRKEQLEDKILTARFLSAVQKRKPLSEALQIYGENGISERNYRSLMKLADNAALADRMRIYYYLSRYMKRENKTFDGKSCDVLESKCFSAMQEEIVENAVKHIPNMETCQIVREEVSVRLPVRVNWGGGWTDTPPFCIENGGVVLNAAIKLKGKSPVHVEVKKLTEYEIRFESEDSGVSGQAKTIEEIQKCNNPYDAFALHKAALVACGIIPRRSKTDLRALLKRYGGGLLISTQVEGVPKGSGLGTSSILAAACVKALFKVFGQPVSDNALCDIVLSMEQLMSTGGGWQDQVGGLVGGVKLITTEPGIDQKLKIEKVTVPKKAMEELSERFILIYTGQRRLARNLLRDVVGSYISGRKETVEALDKMKETTALMEFALKQGDVDSFARQLNRHWELSKQLDGGSTNTCIDQIFLACEDLLSARFIAGAGGGGFLQGILKKGISRDTLSKRLRDVFGDSGVDVWDCEFK